MVDISEKKNRKIVIFGTGPDAVRCMYKLVDKKIDVNFFVNSNCKISTFCNRSVYNPEEVLKYKSFIIVGTQRKIYFEISKMLQMMGLVEFEDYIYYEWLDKKVVLLHGNCHMTIIEEYLESSKQFCNKYSIYPNPLICNNKEGKIQESVLINCDVWIHEDIQDNNSFGYNLSDTYLRKHMRNTVKEIKIPHLFGLGKAFFPQSEWNKRNPSLRNGQDANGMFPHSDIIIDKYIEEKKTAEQICSLAFQSDVLDPQFIQENFELYMNKIKERECAWNIKIYDFILEHYKSEKLFYDMGHPTNIILKKIAVDILNILNINEEIFAKNTLDTHEVPVYPCVKKQLGLKWKDEYIRKSDLACRMSDFMDIKEYIYQYIWWCYGYK